jgi:hypothetical protein
VDAMNLEENPLEKEVTVEQKKLEWKLSKL